MQYGILGGAHYADFLEEMLLLLLENVPLHAYKSIRFQKDSAPLHSVS